MCVCVRACVRACVCVCEKRGETVCSSLLFLHPAVPPLPLPRSFVPPLLSVGSISEAAGAAGGEQVAAFKVVKTTEIGEKRTGGEVCVCVCECV